MWWDEEVHTHIAATNLRPGIVWWDEVEQLFSVELTIHLETSFDVVEVRKRLKIWRHLPYLYILQKQFPNDHITIKMRSCGVPHLLIIFSWDYTGVREHYLISMELHFELLRPPRGPTEDKSLINLISICV